MGHKVSLRGDMVRMFIELSNSCWEETIAERFCDLSSYSYVLGEMDHWFLGTFVGCNSDLPIYDRSNF